MELDSKISFNSQYGKRLIVGSIFFTAFFTFIFLSVDTEIRKILLLGLSLFIFIFVVQSYRLFRSYDKVRLVGEYLIFIGFFGKRKKKIHISDLLDIEEKKYGEMVFHLKNKVRIYIVFVRGTKIEKALKESFLPNLIKTQRNIFPNEKKVKLKLKYI